VNQWFDLRHGRQEEQASRITKIGISCNIIATDLAAVWDVYIDDVTIN
jgi:hypothetical protein